MDENTLLVISQVCTIVTASCAIIAMVCGCLHFKLDKKIKELDLFGHAVVVRQFTPRNGSSEQLTSL